MNTVEKKYPEGTTKEQWDLYEIAKANHEAYCNKKMPKSEQFIKYSAYPYQPGDFDEDAYNSAMREWEKMKFMDAPNQPGYHIANND